MNTTMNRRRFLQTSAAFAAPLILAPGCATLFRRNSMVNIAVIGYGRIAHTMDVPRTIRFTELCRFTAVCDIDSARLDFGRKTIEEYYAKRGISQTVKTYSDYNEMLKDPSIDAVMICTPDHQHALQATACAIAGKHMYLQKPFAQTIQEGRIVANIAQMKGLVLQVGSWQRSRPQFHRVCELVRNGRIGKIVRVEVGLGLDKSGGCRTPEPVPANLDYDAWLGPTDASAPYNWTRVHNQNLKKIGDRPGWIQLAPYGWGMITNWGAHHLDITAWGLGRDATAVRGTCGWMDLSGGRLWNVHTTYDLHYDCAGADVHVNDKFQMGVKFIGENGDWLWCTRGAMKVTPSDPEPKVKPGMLGPIAASKPSLMEPMKDPEIPLLTAENHFLNWLEAVRANNPALAVTNAEGGHRSTSFCSLGRMCMELSRGRKDGASLAWDPVKETTGSADADRMLTPFARGRYDLRNPLREAGLSYEKFIKPLA
jgi:predicted dehydrogenase